jgi:6-phosphogluconolactonase
VIAVSGGTTPWLMLREFARARLYWSSVYVVQVDERRAPRGDPQRNLTLLEEILVAQGPLPATNLLAMQVDDDDPDHATNAYAATLQRYAGGVLDLVQLGLGADGHTASLVPGDAVLAVHDRPVAWSGPYQGTPRMTLTYAALSKARERLWLVTGAAKAAALAQLVQGSGRSPAAAVSRENALVIADAAAAAQVQREDRAGSLKSS